MHSLAGSWVFASCAKIYWPGVVVVVKSSLPSREPRVTYLARTMDLLEGHWDGDLLWEPWGGECSAVFWTAVWLTASCQSDTSSGTSLGLWSVLGKAMRVFRKCIAILREWVTWRSQRGLLKGLLAPLAKHFSFQEETRPKKLSLKLEAAKTYSCCLSLQCGMQEAQNGKQQNWQGKVTHLGCCYDWILMASSALQIKRYYIIPLYFIKHSCDLQL